MKPWVLVTLIVAIFGAAVLGSMMMRRNELSAVQRVNAVQSSPSTVAGEKAAEGNGGVAATAKSRGSEPPAQKTAGPGRDPASAAVRAEAGTGSESAAGGGNGGGEMTVEALIAGFARPPYPKYVALIMQDEFVKMDSAVVELAKKKRVWDVYEQFEDDRLSTDVLPHLEGWCEKSAQPHHAHGLLGIYLNTHAWAVRGDGRGFQVGPAAREGFEGGLRAAKKELETAWESDPTDPIPPSRLVAISVGLGLPKDQMEKYFQGAIKADPAWYAPYSKKLDYLKRKWHGSDEEMFQFARECAKNPPRESHAGRILFDAHAEIADFREGPMHWGRPGVIEELEKVYMVGADGKHDYTKGWCEAAFAAVRCQRYDLAGPLFEKIGANYQNGPWRDLDAFLNDRDAMLENTGRKGEGKSADWYVSVCTQALEKKPDDPVLLFRRGWGYRLANRPREGQADLQRATELRPAILRYRYELGLAYSAMGDLKNAATVFDAVLAESPWDIKAIYGKGEALMNASLFPDAIETFGQGLALSPRWIGLLADMGLCQMKMQEYPKAALFLSKALEEIQLQQSDSARRYEPFVRNMRAYTLVALKRDREAINECREVMKRFPNDTAIASMCAGMLLNSSDASLREPKEALRYAEKAVEVTERQNADYLNTLALAYERNGRRTEAIAVCNEVLRIRPNDNDAAERRKRLAGK